MFYRNNELIRSSRHNKQGLMSLTSKAKSMADKGLYFEILAGDFQTVHERKVQDGLN